MSDLILSAPQGIFLNDLNTKFRSYVGGYGCMRGDTRIHTDKGLTRICDVTCSTRVLSWNEKSQQFQLSLSGGAFPKGRANLYRVTTQQGEFVASGHHRIFSSSGKYESVQSLRVGQQLKTASQYLLKTKPELDPLLSFLDAPHYSKTVEDLHQHYGDEARRYGQQLLTEEESDLFYPPSKDDAHKLRQNCGLALSWHVDDLKALLQERNRRGQSSVQSYMMDYGNPVELLGLCEVSQIASLYIGHTSECHRPSKLYLLKSAFRHIKQLFSSVFHSLHSFCLPINSISSLSEATTIISINQLECNEPYFDMQVLETNNYVCENGLIHHNSGKTFVGCLDLLLFASRHPKVPQGYFGPTYGSIRDIFYPTLEEAAFLLGFKVKINVSNKEVHLYRNGFFYGTIVCRSMDNPNSIIGFKIGRALVDEIDIFTKDKATLAWRKIIARLRFKVDGVVNGIGVTTTPEGFLFVYDTFAKNPTESYSMVQASTYENVKYLPDDYISSLLETYPANIVEAYVGGNFVNLTSGKVYNNYDRILNGTNRTWQPGETIFIGMDFNVGKMAAVAHLKDNGNPIAVDEFMNVYDTPAMIILIKERYPNTNVRVYPDSSGGSRQTVNASISDISLLEAAGFMVVANPSNPFIKDRVMAMNMVFCNNSKERVYKVNADKCPEYADCLEQQTFDNNGKPDKKSGKDHANDAGGYFIAYEYPIIKPVANYSVNIAY